MAAPRVQKLMMIRPGRDQVVLASHFGALMPSGSRKTSRNALSNPSS